MKSRGPSRRGTRRGTILLVVLVVITIAALTGTTTMYLGEAGFGAEGVAIKRVQARALAWSGVQAAMAELADQREALLDGQAPTLTEEWELFADASGVRGIIRLIPVDGTAVATSEAAKLDVNTATVEMLKQIPGFTPTLAAAIVGERSSRPFASVQDLIRVKGFPPELLREPAEDAPEATASVEGGGDESAGLARLLTVFSFDPNIQAGLGDGGAEHRGNLRLNLDLPWSDRLGEAIDARFGDGAGAAVKGLMEKGTKFKSLADVVTAARTAGLAPPDWAEVLDVFSVTDDPFLIGRVDLNLATAEVLAAVPGIGAAAAEKIVGARDGLDPQVRQAVTWPVTEGLVKAEDFVKAVDHLTTRSLQWRVRVEAGLLPSSPAGSASTADAAPLTDKVVLDAVIDVASERPRVAYLRDITLEEVAWSLRDGQVAAAAERGRGPEREPEAAAASPTGPEAPPGPESGADRPSGSGRGSADRKPPEQKRPGPIEEKEPQDAPPEAAPPSEEREPKGVDRRLGRWTAGKNRTGAGR